MLLEHRRCSSITFMRYNIYELIEGLIKVEEKSSSEDEDGAVTTLSQRQLRETRDLFGTRNTSDNEMDDLIKRRQEEYIYDFIIN